MILEKLNGMTVLYAEGDNKITNKSRSLFVNVIYLGKGDSEDNYEEVPYDIWRNYLPELVPPTEVDRLNQKIKNLEMENLILGDIILDTDYRLLQIEIFGLETEF